MPDLRFISDSHLFLFHLDQLVVHLDICDSVFVLGLVKSAIRNCNLFHFVHTGYFLEHALLSRQLDRASKYPSLAIERPRISYLTVSLQPLKNLFHASIGKPVRFIAFFVWQGRVSSSVLAERLQFLPLIILISAFLMNLSLERLEVADGE